MNDLRQTCKTYLSETAASESQIQSFLSQIDRIPDGPLSQAARNTTSHSQALFFLLAETIPVPEVQSLFHTLTEHFDAKYGQLSTIEKGIYWHLFGYLKTLDKTQGYLALRSLNLSSSFLQECDHPLAGYYISRVYNTFGQFSYRNGLLRQAIDNYKVALTYKEQVNDVFGTALTYGNLGRIYYELGEFPEAISSLEKDLDIITSSFPELQQVRAQLMVSIANSYLESRNLDSSEDYFRQLQELSTNTSNAIGQAYALIGLGQVQLSKGNEETASHYCGKAKEAIAVIEAATNRDHLESLFYQFEGSLLEDQGHEARAVESYKKAADLIAYNQNVSRIQVARFLTRYAQLLIRTGNREGGIQQLRKALSFLDMSSAENFRAEVESILKSHDDSSWIKHMFTRFTGISKMETILSQSGQEGFKGREHEAAVLFCDIRKFTTISERLDAQDVVIFLNEFMERMIRTIKNYGGHVDKILGDALMAIFSLPDERIDDCDQAARCALHMIEEVRQMNNIYKDTYPEIEVGIGMHFGSMVAGLIGSASKRSYTVIGDTVNTASRLEGMTKLLGPQILVSDSFMDRIQEPEKLHALPIGRYIPFGRKDALDLWSIEGPVDNAPELDFVGSSRQEATNALTCLNQRDYQSAKTKFASVSQKTGYHAYHMLMKRCEQASVEDEAWDGTIRFDSK